MNKAQVLESLYWHDGVLSKFECLITDTSQILLSCELYENEIAFERQRIELDFLILII